MRKLASEIWGLLVPNERPPSIWLAAKVSRLGGCDNLPAALTRISIILHKNGLIPSSSRGEGDESVVVVRDALCPAHNEAVQVKRHTAWCKLAGKACPNLEKYGDGWAKCKALDKQREAAWWDIQQPKKETNQKGGGLSGLLKIMGPAALTGLAVWKMKEREIDMLKRPPNTSSDAYSIVKNVLKSYGLTYSYNTDTLTFKLQRGSITLDKKGGAQMEGKGKRMRASKSNLLNKVFEFAGLLQ